MADENLTNLPYTKTKKGFPAVWEKKEDNLFYCNGQIVTDKFGKEKVPIFINTNKSTSMIYQALFGVSVDDCIISGIVLVGTFNIEVHRIKSIDAINKKLLLKEVCKYDYPYRNEFPYWVVSLGNKKITAQSPPIDFVKPVEVLLDKLTSEAYITTYFKEK